MKEGYGTVVVRNPRGKHSLGVGILNRLNLIFEGSLGYFAIGLIDGPNVRIHGRVGWDDLNWLEDVHMGYEEGHAAVFDRNINGWVQVPDDIELPDNQQDRDMIARELLIKFQMSERHPMVQLREAYKKF